jgi:hypothetical protein
VTDARCVRAEHWRDANTGAIGCRSNGACFDERHAPFFSCSSAPYPSQCGRRVSRQTSASVTPMSRSMRASSWDSSARCWRSLRQRARAANTRRRIPGCAGERSIRSNESRSAVMSASRFTRRVSTHWTSSIGRKQRSGRGGFHDWVRLTRANLSPRAHSRPRVRLGRQPYGECTPLFRALQGSTRARWIAMVSP